MPAGIILSVLIHINKDKEPEINAFGETFARIEFTQVVQVTDSKFKNTVCGRSLPFTIHVLATRILLPSLLYASGMQR